MIVKSCGSDGIRWLSRVDHESAAASVTYIDADDDDTFNVIG